MSDLRIFGKMSWFGGPDDTGVAPDEDLALVYSQGTFNQLRDYFLDEQPPGTTGYARRLDPQTFYVACRWDYSQTSKSYLRGIMVTVTNPANGRTAQAKPIDWGPHGDTDRAADLSPGLLDELGLVTDDLCEVLVPLPLPAAAVASVRSKEAATAPPKEKEWTILVYIAGDNDLSEFGMADLREMKTVGSNADINIVAQYDPIRRDSETRRFLLTQGGSLDADEVGSFPETNTGDPKVLADFLLWGVKSFPAKRFMVVLWNHGAGWDDADVYERARSMGFGVVRRSGGITTADARRKRTVSASHLSRVASGRTRRSLFATSFAEGISKRAIAFDDEAKDFLDNIEMKKVLARVRKAIKRPIDILGMDACLMSMFEVAYQIKGAALVTVGSEELEPGDGWPYHTILADLAKKPLMDAREFGAVIVKRYLESYPKTEEVTQSACDLAKSAALKKATDALAKALKKCLADPGETLAILKSRRNSQAYDAQNSRGYVDLHDLCGHLARNVKSAAVKSACKAVRAEIARFVIANGHKGSRLSGSNGVSIYFPTDEVSDLYRTLDFAKQGAWDDFLRSLLS